MRAVAAAPWALGCEGKGGRSSAPRVYVHIKDPPLWGGWWETLVLTIISISREHLSTSRDMIIELELELIQSHMAQKPVLRGEVGCACVACEVSVVRGGMGERGCARRLGGWVWVRKYTYQSDICICLMLYLPFLSSCC